MSRLVGRLLELSRLEADCSTPEAVNLSQLVLEVSHGRLSVEASVPKNDVFIIGRHVPLRTAILNLLDNAEQHSDSSRRVNIRLRCKRGGLCLDVENQGDAISAGNLQHIWQRFFTTRVDVGGSGLGLAIVRSVVEAHGGEVHASSGPEGTIIGFWLPG